MKSKILITGSQGFIGKILVKEFKNSNKLILIDNKKNFSNQNNFHQINLLNQENLEEIFKKNKISSIIHLASEIFDDDKNVYAKMSQGGRPPFFDLPVLMMMMMMMIIMMMMMMMIKIRR